MKKYIRVIGTVLTLVLILNFNFVKAQDNKNSDLSGTIAGTAEAVGGFDFENAPTLSDTELTLKVGEKYDFDVNNKADKSKYYYTSLSAKVASITPYKGIVIGKEEGITTVYCKITLSDGTIGYLKCKVNVIE